MKGLLLLIVAALFACRPAEGQAGDPPTNSVAVFFGLQADIDALSRVEARQGIAQTPLEELVLRQRISEGIASAVLDVDSVIAEISSEQSSLGEVKAELLQRQQRKVNRLTTAALLTGSALGAGVSATQFSSVGSITQNVGDAIGIGSGVASTVLSFLATRAQNGSVESVGNVPNMLAPLFDEAPPPLQNPYPPAVLAYLNAPPAPQSAAAGTPLERLMESWRQAGRFSNRAVLTTSGKAVKLSAQDLDNRIAMLGDVRSRVAIIKRDLATLMHDTLIKRSGTKN